jgi:hypothetical protein
LTRLCLATLRTADEPISIDDIARQVISAKGFDGGDSILHRAIRDQIGDAVKRLNRRREVEKTGRGRTMQWKLSNQG